MSVAARREPSTLWPIYITQCYNKLLCLMLVCVPFSYEVADYKLQSWFHSCLFSIRSSLRVSKVCVLDCRIDNYFMSRIIKCALFLDIMQTKAINFQHNFHYQKKKLKTIFFFCNNHKLLPYKNKCITLIPINIFKYFVSNFEWIFIDE